MSKNQIEIIDENKDVILKLAMQSTSISNLLKNLGWSKGEKIKKKLDELLKIFNFEINTFKINLNNKSKCVFNNENLFRKIISESISYSDVLRKFNKKCGSGNYLVLQKYIKKYDLDISHFDPNKRFSKSYYKIKTSDELFCQNSSEATSTIRRRILGENLLEYKCVGEGCNITGQWLGKKIALQLDHINGINNDHRLENLRFLCPNCHCATPTWGNKKNHGFFFAKRKINENLESGKLFILFKESKEIFLDKKILELNNNGDILKYFKVSRNSKNYKILNKVLEDNKNHPNVIAFLNKQKKDFNLYTIEELIMKIKNSSFVKVSKELNCSDNGLRKYLIKNGIDVKSIKK